MAQDNVAVAQDRPNGLPPAMREIWFKNVSTEKDSEGNNAYPSSEEQDWDALPAGEPVYISISITALKDCDKHK